MSINGWYLKEKMANNIPLVTRCGVANISVDCAAGFLLGGYLVDCCNTGMDPSIVTGMALAVFHGDLRVTFCGASDEASGCASGITACSVSDVFRGD
jgi:hypothetical protein